MLTPLVAINMADQLAAGVVRGSADLTLRWEAKSAFRMTRPIAFLCQTGFASRPGWHTTAEGTAQT